LAIGALFVVALVLRATQLHQSLYGDEVLALHDISGHGLIATVHAVRTGAESSPPLFFVLAWFSAKLGDPTVWIRLPSLVLGSLTVPLVYLLGRETLSRGAGLIAAAVMTVSPFANYYGVEARPYATLACLLTLSTWALVRAVRSQRPAWWVLYAVAAAGAAYTHYTAVFVLGVQGLWSLWACRGRWGQPLLAGALALGLYLPWLPEVHGSALGLYGALERFDFTDVGADVLRLIPGDPYAPVTAIPTVGGLILLAVCLSAGLVALVARRRPLAEAGAVDGGPILILLLAAATPVGLLLYSLVGPDIWDARDLFASAPAVGLVFGLVLSRLSRGLGGVALLAVIAVLVFGLARSVSERWARPPFRAVAAYLDARAPAGDPVVMYPFFLNLSDAVPAQFESPHRLVFGIPHRWPSPPPGGSTWILLEPVLDHALHIPEPRPPGLRLIAVRRYGGLVPFTLLRYATP
jgi:hypothetical protein